MACTVTERCAHGEVDFIGYQQDYTRGPWPMYRCRGCNTTLGPERAWASRVHVPADAVRRPADPSDPRVACSLPEYVTLDDRARVLSGRAAALLLILQAATLGFLCYILHTVAR